MISAHVYTSLYFDRLFFHSLPFEQWNFLFTLNHGSHQITFQYVPSLSCNWDGRWTKAFFKNDTRSHAGASLFVCWDISAAIAGRAGGFWQLAPGHDSAQPHVPIEPTKLFIDFDFIISLYQRISAIVLSTINKRDGPCRTFCIESSGFYWEDLPL